MDMNKLAKLMQCHGSAVNVCVCVCVHAEERGQSHANCFICAAAGDSRGGDV